MGNYVTNPVSIYGANIFAKSVINNHEIYMIGEDHKDTSKNTDIKYDYRVEDIKIPDGHELWLEYSEFEKQKGIGDKGTSALSRIRKIYKDINICKKIDSRMDEENLREFSYDMIVAIKNFYMNDSQIDDKYVNLYNKLVSSNNFTEFKSGIIKVLYEYVQKDDLSEYMTKYFDVLENHLDKYYKIRQDIGNKDNSDWTNLLPIQSLTSTFGSIILDIQLIKKICNLQNDIVLYMGADHIKRIIDGIQFLCGKKFDIITNESNVVIIESNKFYPKITQGGNSSTDINIISITVLILLVLYLIMIIYHYIIDMVQVNYKALCSCVNF